MTTTTADLISLVVSLKTQMDAISAQISAIEALHNAHMNSLAPVAPVPVIAPVPVMASVPVASVPVASEPALDTCTSQQLRDIWADLTGRPKGMRTSSGFPNKAALIAEITRLRSLPPAERNVKTRRTKKVAAPVDTQPAPESPQPVPEAPQAPQPVPEAPQAPQAPQSVPEAPQAPQQPKVKKPRVKKAKPAPAPAPEPMNTIVPSRSCPSCNLGPGNDHRMCIATSFNCDVDAWEKASMSTDEKVYRYLFELQESGSTNMMGAAAYIVRQFPDIPLYEAREILVHWMTNYSKIRKFLLGDSSSEDEESVLMTVESALKKHK
jgi:hypothetical protein